MREKKLSVFILIIFFIFLFFLFPLPKKQAQTTLLSPQPTVIVPSNNNQLNILIELLKIIFIIFQNNNNNLYNNQQTQTNQLKTIFPTNGVSDVEITPDVNGLVYYSQCQGPYDNYPLPQGGTVCKAGCGPTTVAMIVASYIDKSITPPKIVEEYKKSGYYLGPAGSYYSHAENVIKKHNLKTTYIFADNQAKTVDQVMNQFGGIIKNYQKSGWTFFALANFCDGGCGHFFWIIKIDEGLNIWAYDPAYDIKLPKPINHKKRYPFPKLRVIFGVKK